MSYQYLYELGAAISGLTGTVTISAGSAVSGSATNFDAKLAAGDLLTIGSEPRVVNAVASATALTVTSAYASSGSGLAYSAVGMNNVEALGVQPPLGTFRPYSLPLKLGDGTLRGGGWKTCEWRWGFVSQAMRDALRAYCPGASASLWLRTRQLENADAFAYYSGVMLWPEEEQRDTTRRLDFVLRFQALQPITVS